MVELKDVVNRLKRIKSVEAIHLFGSRARSTATATSDYDIMVWTNPAVSVSEKDFGEVFKFPKKFDIKFHDLIPVGDMMMVADRMSWLSGEEGTYISSDILEDMKVLWQRRKQRRKKPRRG